MNDIVKFIKKFQGEDTISIFTNNCSYWFAFILYKRFIRNGAKIMVNTESKYFGTEIDGRIYDITGDISDKYHWIPWVDIDNETVKNHIISKYIN